VSRTGPNRSGNRRAEKIKRILEKHPGISAQKIADRLGCHYGTVKYHLQRDPSLKALYTHEGTSGPERIFTLDELKAALKRNKGSTQLELAKDMGVSLATLQKRFRENPEIRPEPAKTRVEDKNPEIYQEFKRLMKENPDIRIHDLTKRLGVGHAIICRFRKKAGLYNENPFSRDVKIATHVAQRLDEDPALSVFDLADELKQQWRLVYHLMDNHPFLRRKYMSKERVKARRLAAAEKRAKTAPRPASYRGWPRTKGSNG
jgi:transposase